MTVELSAVGGFLIIILGLVILAVAVPPISWLFGRWADYWLPRSTPLHPEPRPPSIKTPEELS